MSATPMSSGWIQSVCEQRATHSPSQGRWGWTRWVGVLAMAMLMCQCSDSEPSALCGSGDDLAVSGVHACVYEAALVIETQFRCPAERPHREDANGLIICSDRGDLTEEELLELERQFRGDSGEADLDVGWSDLEVGDVPSEPIPDILDGSPMDTVHDPSLDTDLWDAQDWGPERDVDCPFLSSECTEAGWDGSAEYLCLGPDRYGCALACFPDCGCDELLTLEEEESSQCDDSCDEGERSLAILLPEPEGWARVDGDAAILEVQVLLCGVTLVDHVGLPHTEGEGHLLVQVDEVQVGGPLILDHFAIGLPAQFRDGAPHRLRVTVVNNDGSSTGIPPAVVNFFAE